MKNAVLVLSFVIGFAAQVVAAPSQVGQYRGEFEGRPGVLTISKGDAYSVSFQGDDGSNDLLGAECSSVIGPVKEVKEKKGELRSLDFEFSPGNCIGIQGRELDIDIKKGKLEISLFSHVEEGAPSCHYDQFGRRYCEKNWWYIYLTGEFKKIN